MVYVNESNTVQLKKGQPIDLIIVDENSKIK